MLWVWHTNPARTDVHATPGGERVQRLSGDEDEKVCLAKSLRVMPGDTIYMEIKAKYASNQRGSSEGDPVLALTGALHPASVALVG